MVVAADISKDSLRKLALSKRKNIEKKHAKEEIISKKILNHDKIKSNSDILIYISKKDEVSTIKLINGLLGLGKNIYVPKIVDKDISFYQINSFADLVLGSFNIQEPITKRKFNQKNGVIIVPGLMFDKYNNRLGYGMGYYDRYLNKTCNLYKIGICFSEFLTDELVVDKYDVKMDEVITER